MSDQIKERPILFSSEMVRAVLDGRKTETRRVVKPQPSSVVDWEEWGVSVCTPKGSISGRGRFPTNHLDPGESSYGEQFFKSPYGMPGDILYVREGFYYDGFDGEIPDEISNVIYRADCDEPDCKAYIWKPSIHMPKKYSRIKLKINEIRVERVKDITEDGAKFEGLKSSTIISARENFSALWQCLNRKRGFGWDKNPYVWVINFDLRG